jgi:hypothetical protein
MAFRIQRAFARLLRICTTPPLSVPLPEATAERDLGFKLGTFAESLKQLSTIESGYGRLGPAEIDTKIVVFVLFFTICDISVTIILLFVVYPD